MATLRDTWHTASRYAHYKLTARHGRGHGIHSPFLYEFVERVLCGPRDLGLERENAAFESSLRRDRSTLRVYDLGAGAASLGVERRVRDIARGSATPRRARFLLGRMARHYRPASVLELGTSLGITAHALALSSAAGVDSVEGSPELHRRAGEALRQAGVQNARLHLSDFDAFLATYRPAGALLAYVDGNHRAEPTLRYVDALWQAAPPGSIIAVGDIHWSAGMSEAWARLARRERCKYTVDLFHLGLVAKLSYCDGGHFTIRH